jgi:archaellum biogenesis ATPase FlaH
LLLDAGKAILCGLEPGIIVNFLKFIPVSGTVATLRMVGALGGRVAEVLQTLRIYMPHSEAGALVGWNTDKGSGAKVTWVRKHVLICKNGITGVFVSCKLTPLGQSVAYRDAVRRR